MSQQEEVKVLDLRDAESVEKTLTELGATPEQIAQVKKQAQLVDLEQRDLVAEGKAAGYSDEGIKALIKAATETPDLFRDAQKLAQELKDKRGKGGKIKGISIKRLTKRVGRNEPCPNHPDKKYKNCSCYHIPKPIGAIYHRESPKTAE
jgi:uncharacterized protein YecA (UPF0149 family)